MTDTFVWERCTPDLGSGCADIPGSSQTVPEGTQAARTSTGDIGYRLRARGYRNGVLIGESDPTGVVTAQSDIWQWDAVHATLLADQSRAALVQSHASPTEFAATVAIIRPPAGTARYHVASTDGSGSSADVPIPGGTQPGGSTDHHLAVVDNTDGTDGAVYDMWEANPAAHTAVGVGTVVPGGVHETFPGQSNAGHLDLSRVITIDDFNNGILRTLVFGMPIDAHLGNPSVYPSNANFNDARIPYGQWLRLNPAGVVPNYGTSGLGRFTAYIDACLRTHGMILRDQASGIVLFGEDYVNQGGNVSSWGAAGVPLTLQGAGDSYPIGCFLTGIPWSQLQALAPPSP